MNYKDVADTFEELSFGNSITDMAPAEIGFDEIKQFFDAIRQVDPSTDTDITLGMLDARMSIGDQYAGRFRANFAESPEAFVQNLDNFVTKLETGEIEPEAGFHQFLATGALLGAAEVPGGQEELSVADREAAIAERTNIVEQEAATISNIAHATNLDNGELEKIIAESNLSSAQIDAITTNIEVASITSPNTSWSNLSNSFANVASIDQAPSTLQQPQMQAPKTADVLPEVDTATATQQTLASMSKAEIEEAIIGASENNGGTYETYESAFVALNPDYQGFFDGVKSQTARGSDINPLKEQLTDALNTDPSVGANMVLIANDPEKLEALTTLVTEDSDPLTFLRDEAEVESLINSFAEVNGSAPLAPAQEIQPLPELVQQQVEQIQAGNIDEAPSMQTPTPLAPPTQDSTPNVDTTPAVTPLNVSATVNATPALDTYTVEKGDTLWGMGREMGLSNAETANFVQHMTILNSDKISDPDKIYPGNTHAIPSPEMLAVDASDYYADKSAADIKQMRDDAMNANTSSQQGAAIAIPAQAAAAPSI